MTVTTSIVEGEEDDRRRSKSVSSADDPSRRHSDAPPAGADTKVVVEVTHTQLVPVVTSSCGGSSCLVPLVFLQCVHSCTLLGADLLILFSCIFFFLHISLKKRGEGESIKAL